METGEWGEDQSLRVPDASASGIARVLAATLDGSDNVTLELAAGSSRATGPFEVSLRDEKGILIGEPLSREVASLSDVPITISRKLSDALVDASRARDIPAKLKSFAHLSARDLLPVPPAITSAPAPPSS